MAPASRRSVGAQQRWLTTADVTATLRVTPDTVYRLIRTGDLPAVRVGGQWRFRETDLTTWSVRHRGPGKRHQVR